VVRACLDDRADVGIAVAMEVSKGLDCWRFASDPVIVLLPVGHPLEEREKLSFREVLEWGVVGVQPGGSLDQAMREAAEIARVPFRPKVSVNGFDAACRMVEAGLGIAIVPTSAAAAFAGTPRFLRRELDEPWSARELLLYALQKQPRPAAAEALLNLLRC
jgi:DNA-binding transcriptional LysR family regulator